MKFKKGEKVKFVALKYGRCIPNDFYTHIKGIIHGQTVLDMDYYNTKGMEILSCETKYNIPYYLVRYKGDNGRFVQLGFKENQLKPMKIDWRTRLV